MQHTRLYSEIGALLETLTDVLDDIPSAELEAADENDLREAQNALSAAISTLRAIRDRHQ